MNANQGIAGSLRALIGWGFNATAKLRHPRTEDGAIPPPAASDKPLIVFVHGYQGAVCEFAEIHRRLYAALGNRFDFAAVDTLDPTMDGSPDENARRVVEYLAAFNLASRDIYLICHSLGGLIARRVTHLPNAPTIRAIVMLATPNAGIRSWNLLPIHWMRSRGFEQRFTSHYPALRPIRYLVLAGTRGTNLLEGSPNDGVVSLKSALTLNGEAEIETHTYLLDHWGLLRDEQVVKDIEEFLIRG
ncbi:MAG: alpha/beta fold hydrolase [Armatimonadota bacterium]